MKKLAHEDLYKIVVYYAAFKSSKGSYDRGTDFGKWSYEQLEAHYLAHIKDN